MNAQNPGPLRSCRTASIEVLEKRWLLDATVTSVAVGDMLFTAVASGTNVGSTDLYRSNLDGSDQVLLGHWWSGTEGPNNLFGFHGELFFAATTQAYWSRQFVWKSDGTVQGTVPVGTLLQYGSYPHDFMVVNDHLLYLAQDYDHRDEIFTTNGNGFAQLISPPWDKWITGGYYYGFSHMVVIGDRLYAEVSEDVSFSSTLRQTERWQTDGTVEGTRIADPFGLIQDGILRIFGTTGSDTIRIDSNRRQTKLRINGALQTFNNADFSSIFLSALQGDDSIVLGPDVTCPATIDGNIGNDTIVGGRGNDFIDGGAGTDLIDGGKGDDQIIGGDSSTHDGDTLRGGQGDDRIVGSSGDDLVDGGAGNDSIDGDGGFDSLEGGAGNDTLTGGYNSVTISGGTGDDVISGGWGDDSLSGGPGNDSISAGPAEDTLNGGAGSDTLDAGTGLDSIVADKKDTVIDPPMANLTGYGWLDVSGTFGNDVINIRLKDGDPATLQVSINGKITEFAAADVKQTTVATGSGNDVMVIDPSVNIFATIKGGSGDDSIIGGGRNDVIYGGDGRDTLRGGSGDDTLDGGAGNDLLDGGDGNDRISYASRTQRIFKSASEQVIRTDLGEADQYLNVEGILCGSGDDIIQLADSPSDIHYVDAGDGNNSIVGSEMNDTIVAGGNGQGTLFGGGGDDRITVGYGNGSALIDAGAGNDNIVARNDGDNTIFGGDGNDWIDSGDGNDWIDGGDGNDFIHANNGNNTVYGGAGDDQISTGYGNDLIDRGGGNNTVESGGGNDTIVG